MKKTLIIFIGCLVLLACTTTFAKNKVKRPRPGRSIGPDSRENADPNDPNVQARAKRIKQRVQQRNAKAQERAKATTKKATQVKSGHKKGSTLKVDKTKQKESFTKQIAHEQEKHKTRQAKLERIRKLAEDLGDEKILARANKLIKKEQARHDNKMQRLQKKRAAIKSKEEIEKKIREKVKESKKNMAPKEKDGNDANDN